MANTTVLFDMFSLAEAAYATFADTSGVQLVTTALEQRECLQSVFKSH